MPVSTEIRRTEIKDEFRKCTACGYGRGFHCSFQRKEEGLPGFIVLLICPNCGTRFNIGWKIEILE